MIRVILDTNVLASGFAGLEISGSTPGPIIGYWRAGRFELVTSAHILTELRRTLAKPYDASRPSSVQISAAPMLLSRATAVVVPNVVISGVATHPEDDLVLAEAVSAQVDYLVTGDKQLQRLGSYQEVSIVSPRQVPALLEQQESIQ